MKTLANFENYNEFLYPRIEFMREVFESVLHQLLTASKEKRIVVKTHQSNGKLYAKPRCTLDVNYAGKKWAYDRVIGDIDRIYAMCAKSPVKSLRLKSKEDKIKWMEQHAQSALDMIANDFQRAMLFQAAQVAEKGIDKKYRERFKFGKVNGQYMPGKVHEVLQAEEFERCGGKAIISSSSKMTVNKEGEITLYQKNNRSTSGKQLDLLFEGTYVKFYTTNKAHTAELDGGGRTSEYESDAGKTVQKRSERFEKKGYEISDGKIVLLGGLVDSRFFAGNQGANAIRLMQVMANNKDTFILNASILAKFINLIDVPALLTDTESVIQTAFDQLAVEV